MRVLNSKGSSFTIGKKVVMTKPYVSGSVNLLPGNVGIITGMSIMNLPDMGLFDLRVYDIDFFIHKVSFGEMVMKEYVSLL